MTTLSEETFIYHLVLADEIFEQNLYGQFKPFLIHPCDVEYEEDKIKIIKAGTCINGLIGHNISEANNLILKSSGNCHIISFDKIDEQYNMKNYKGQYYLTLTNFIDDGEKVNSIDVVVPLQLNLKISLKMPNGSPRSVNIARVFLVDDKKAMDSVYSFYGELPPQMNWHLLNKLLILVNAYRHGELTKYLSSLDYDLYHLNDIMNDAYRSITNEINNSKNGIGYNVYCVNKGAEVEFDADWFEHTKFIINGTSSETVLLGRKMGGQSLLDFLNNICGRIEESFAWYPKFVGRIGEIKKNNDYNFLVYFTNKIITSSVVEDIFTKYLGDKIINVHTQKIILVFYPIGDDGVQLITDSSVVKDKPILFFPYADYTAINDVNYSYIKEMSIFKQSNIH